FSFVGYAESFITFGVSRVDNDRETTLDPYIWLQAPSGETIAEADDHADSDDALVIHLPLEATGVYTLFLNSSDNQGVGPYRVAIGEGFIRYDVDQGGAAHDQPLIASIADYGVRDVWTIDVESGDLISISVEAWDESPLDPMVELVAPTGETLAFDDDSGAGGNAFLSSIPAPVTGTYRIHIAAYSHASLGSYRLWWRRDNLFPTPTAAPATATSPVSNSATVTPTGTPFTIDIPTGTPIIATTESSPTPILSSSGSLLFDLLEGEQLVQPIELDAGQQLNIFVEGHWGFDGVLEIVAPGGQVLQRVDDIGFGETFDINPRLVQDIATSGRYTIRVYGYENSGGTFTLHWLIR
ncbi:MAG: hypothetical protein GYB66_15805, partial [Chloroflexi bacterium]|nr:hypothetical protein [Chloroflexota bacterium]